MKVLKHTTDNKDWIAWYLMESNSHAFSKAHMYKNDNFIILSELSVSSNFRNKGLGTKMQELREQLGVSLGCTESYLWVEKGSWMEGWYKRRGYKYFSDHKDEPDNIWMVKNLT